MTDSATLSKKLPEEIWFVDFDFTALFDSGVTISTPVCSIALERGVTDGAMASMISDSPVVVGMVASQRVKLGVPTNNYRLKMKVTGSDTSVQVISLILPVVASRLG